MKKIKTGKKIKRKDYSNQKGITLIALVVTIAVLLILAGVTIAEIFNDEGLWDKSNEFMESVNTTIEKNSKQINNMINELDAIMNSDSQKATTEGNTTGGNITDNETKTVTDDISGQEELQFDSAIYDGQLHTVSYINKVEILSGSTVKNITFCDCEEIIINSNAVLENVRFNSNRYIKMTETLINYCNFQDDGMTTFEKCTISDSSINDGTVQYINCTVDGQPYSN